MTAIEEFIKKESSAGIVLIFVTVIALLLKNTGLSDFYDAFLNTPVEVRFGALHIDKPLLLWINDGLMAVFFLLIGLEVKREIIEGHLSSPAQVVLPGFAAVGGMVVPAAVYLYFVGIDSPGTQGWAIPTATDIAFALGVLSLLGKRVPVSLKIFLMALAIIDDLGAIIIIALFYTVELSTLSIVVAAAALTTLVVMNRLGVDRKAAYVIVGVILWISVLKSGVHATLAGVALAFTIPLKQRPGKIVGRERSMLKSMEHDLHYWVAFFILPLFAFVNAGVDFRDISVEQILTPVPLGIAAGLFIGKQVGVFFFSWIAIKLKLAKMPDDSNMTQIYGVSILTGIGFTMSLFVNSLAFTDPTQFMFADKLAILVGSFASGVIGYLVLRYSTHSAKG
ncbi:Na+/H+ antiporter NhaA [Psychrobium sp. 1_MG-2023]|uniref:Na+/H+ antiporter NhaA n=1 Tax=Psychrobium sp. 1_MG-2023 TaxID=3062624 RepID=UPI000C32DD1D|nr:Na+/H+ antiporter NhaA [Psychrobium sp. 1_MG-2023]MDP2560144.1 Na+/H+ antiporter NhaA [Psychrobium sp. 1_MG-2023]PKF56957.1 Na+/H+ antiporter NhaA [Alteromonadales bacterium alter-6D02]